MTLTLDIPVALEVRLREHAARAGLEPADYARLLLEQHLPPDGSVRATLELFARWEADDATDDPTELARRQQEAEEFMRAMNRNRVASEGPAARKPYPGP